MTTAGGPSIRGPTGEQSRARYPDVDGHLTRNGVRIHYEVYGHGEPTIVLLPTWSVVPSRMWKMQIPYLSRHARVVTFDGRGHGGSDRPLGVEHYRVEEFAADAVAVMDQAAVSKAVLVAESCGALWASLLGAYHPDRVDGIVYVAPAVGLAPEHPQRRRYRFDASYETHEGWAKYNRHFWLSNYGDFLQFFFRQCFNEAHSTKAIEDCVGWGLETSPERLIEATEALFQMTIGHLEAALSRITCPTLVVHGDADMVRPPSQGAALAAATGGRLVTLQGAGHLPHVRDPVAVNHIIRDFACPPAPPAAWRRARDRPKRALVVSSPIGLGHARRDVAIAAELKKLVPGLVVDWLAQSPVTSVLEHCGERVHPASRFLASESGHFESEAAEHDLHCFQAWRRMDEILLANFMVLDDLLREDHYDLVVGDEAWDIDHYLHENPELKRSPFAWLTDFVGWLPMPDGGDAEAEVAADYNAEMIEHLDRYPRLRDRSIFVGDPDDVVPDHFGAGLPSIRAWTEEHFSFAGYITGFEPTPPSEREGLRERCGWGPDEVVCVATVGGTSVGRALLQRVIDSYPAAADKVDGLRMIVVSGPRIEPGSLHPPAGVEVVGYVPDLYRLLAACDVAIVQGGLTTAMELTANGRPFLYFPLRHHFEQNIHVRYRLERHRAGRPMDYSTAGPDEIAAALRAELGRPLDYAPVDPGGAARAAAMLAELL